MRRGGCARSLAGFARGRFFFFFPWCARALVVGWLRAGRGVGMSCGGGGGRPASLLRAPPVTDDDREPPLPLVIAARRPIPTSSPTSARTSRWTGAAERDPLRHPSFSRAHRYVQPPKDRPAGRPRDFFLSPSKRRK